MHLSHSDSFFSAEFLAELQQIRRDIHAHPELCFEEQRTADLVANKLTEWSIPFIRGMGITGNNAWNISHEKRTVYKQEPSRI